MSLEVTKKNVAAVGLKAGPIFVAAVCENGYLLFSEAFVVTLTPMLKSRCLMFSVPTDQVYLELGAVDSYASDRRKGHRPACRVVHLNLFRGNNLRNTRRF